MNHGLSSTTLKKSPEKPGSRSTSTLCEKIKLTIESEEIQIDSRSSSLQLSSSVSQSNDPVLSKFKKVVDETYVFEPSQIDSMKTISDMSFNMSFNTIEVLSEAWRMSEAITSAKNSFLEQNKHIGGKYSIDYTSFAVPSRMYCSACQKEVFTKVSFQLTELGLWNSIQTLINSLKCCEEKPNSKKRLLVHSCNKCFSILAKVSMGI
jgi:hypothetical protein